MSMPMHQRSHPTRWKILTGLATLAILGGTRLAVGSDHQDTPDVEANPKQDMTDVYAFPSPTAGRIVLVMNSRAFLTPAGAAADPSFDPDQLYQFRPACPLPLRHSGVLMFAIGRAAKPGP